MALLRRLTSPWVALALAAAGFLALMLWPTWVSIASDCQSPFDLGIYSQAVGAFRWNDWNPYLSARNVRIFNDHLDPLLLVTVVPRLVLSPRTALVLTEWVMVVSPLGVLLWLHRKKALDASAVAVLGMVLLLDIATWDAVRFPAHPTTWSVLGASVLGAALLLESSVGVVAGAVLFMACKEDNPFAVVALGAVLLVRQRRLGLGLLALAFAWLGFVFVVRPLVWGPTEPHAAWVLGGASEHPLDFVLERLTNPQARRLGTWLLPLVPLAVCSALGRRRWSLGLLAAAGAMVAVRLLSLRWAFHYGPPVVGLVVASAFVALRGVSLPRWVVWTTLAVLALTNELNLKRLWNQPAGFAMGEGRCLLDPQRTEDLARASRWLVEHPQDAALVQGNLVAAVAARPDIFSLTSSTLDSAKPYRYLLVEKSPNGVSWPFDQAELDRRVARYLTQPHQVLLDTPWVLLAEGPFTPE